MGKLKSPSGHTSLENALRLLDLFSIEQPELGITEIAASLNIGLSTAHRMAISLAAEGFLVKDKQSNQYRLGTSWLSLGNIVQQRMEIYQTAFPYLEKLVEQAKETVQLSTLSGTNILYICHIDPTHSVSLKTDVGMELPAHCTALGRAMLAFSPEEKAEEVIRRGLHPFTKHTVTDVTQFRDILHEIKQKKVAVCIEQYHEQRNSIAAPILNEQGRSIAAVAIVGPSKRIHRHAIPQLSKLVAQTAQHISERMRQ